MRGLRKPQPFAKGIARSSHRHGGRRRALRKRIAPDRHEKLGGSKTGGYVVYSTCSVSVEENEASRSRKPLRIAAPLLQAVVDHALKTRNVELVSFTSSVSRGLGSMFVRATSRYPTRYRRCPLLVKCGHSVAVLRLTSSAQPCSAVDWVSVGLDSKVDWHVLHPGSRFPS